jgi:hypothetical protein
MLILAVDANFRLKNRMRANEIDDPSLGPGWGYWVEPERYTSHVKKYVNEKDVSWSVCACCLKGSLTLLRIRSRPVLHSPLSFKRTLG